MSIKTYQPHLIVLPEDRANERIANGFIDNLNVNERAIQVDRPAGGWLKVVKKFTEVYVDEMRQFTRSMIVLLIDFDLKENRFIFVQDSIPDDLRERVFILGVRDEPEKLSKAIKFKKSLEEIGETLAEDCANNTNKLWGHDLLKDNQAELERMRSSVKPFLFL